MVVIFTTCSGCCENVILSIRPSRNGTAHVGDLVADIFYDGSDLDNNTFSLPMWDCPACGYADSYDHNYYA